MVKKIFKLSFDGQARIKLEQLRKKMGAKDKVEVVRDAVVLLEQMIKISKGKDLIVYAKGSKKKKLITIPQKKVKKSGVNNE